MELPIHGFINDDDDLDEINLVIFGIPRRVCNRHNYFESFDDLTFFQRFRVTKPTALQILNEIEADIEFPYDM